MFQTLAANVKLELPATPTFSTSFTSSQQSILDHANYTTILDLDSGNSTDAFNASIASTASLDDSSSLFSMDTQDDETELYFAQTKKVGEPYVTRPSSLTIPCSQASTSAATPCEPYVTRPNSLTIPCSQASTSAATPCEEPNTRPPLKKQKSGKFVSVYLFIASFDGYFGRGGGEIP